MRKHLIQRLQSYELLCNRYAVDQILDVFCDDGCIVIAGVAYCGKEKLHGAHDFDRGNLSQVRYFDFKLDGDRVTCAFDSCDEMDRVSGLDGWHMSAEFTFVDGKIHRFLGHPPTLDEMRRHQAAKRPFQDWARKTHRNAWAKAFAFDAEAGFTGFDYELGALRTHLAHAWRDSLESESVPGAYARVAAHLSEV